MLQELSVAPLGHLYERESSVSVITHALSNCSVPEGIMRSINQCGLHMMSLPRRAMHGRTLIIHVYCFGKEVGCHRGVLVSSGWYLTLNHKKTNHLDVVLNCRSFYRWHRPHSFTPRALTVDTSLLLLALPPSLHSLFLYRATVCLASSASNTPTESFPLRDTCTPSLLIPSVTLPASSVT